MIRVGVDVHDSILEAAPQRRRDLLERAASGGLTHVCVGDHVSFHDGAGFDGMVSAAAALASHDRLEVWIAVYQLALRHPVTVARQLASLSQMAPGRLVLGIGAGGDDRNEVSNCGVEPATRGRRLDESLAVLSALARGGAVDHEGKFFQLEGAKVAPAPNPSIPVAVGGNSEAAVRRAARFGDGWIGIFLSARRFRATADDLLTVAHKHGRPPPWLGLQVWCGLDPNPSEARRMLAEKIQDLYRLPYDRFQQLAPAGKAAEVADWLVPFAAAGADRITLLPVARHWEAGVDQVVEVRDRLLTLVGGPDDDGVVG